MQKKNAIGLKAAIFTSFAVAMLIGNVSWSQTEAAMPDQTTEFNIPAGDLATALKSFGEQSDTDVLFDPQVTASKHTAGLTGTHETQAGLRILLAEANLQFRVLGGKTVLIEAVDGEAITLFLGSGEGGAAERGMRVAQNEQEQKTDQPSGEKDESQDTKLQEIVVTAQKRAENLEDVPIAISVLNGEMLDNSSVRGSTDALRVVPGVTVLEGFQTGGTSIQIRGVGASSPFGGGASSVAYYLDSVPFGMVTGALAPDAGAYDLQRIEVLRGPQGTLYGASALNGVVRVLTNDADLDAFEFKGRVAGSSTDGGGGNYRGDAALNIPISEGRLAVRAVGGYQHLSGWIDHPNAQNVNDGDIRNLRLKVNAQPIENLTLGLSTWISRSDFGGPSTAADNGVNRAVLDEGIESGFEAYGAQIGYDFGAFTVSSATSVLNYRLDSSLDLVNIGLGGNALDTHLDARVFAEEVNINSSGEGPWRWSLGLFYRDAWDQVEQLRHDTAGAPSLTYLQPNRIRFLSESYAAYGEITREFADGHFDLTAGLRYFHDDVGLRELQRSDSLTLPVVSRDASFDATTPRAVLTWHPTNLLDTYLSYSEGFRSGRDNAPLVVRTDPSFRPVEPDTLRNYEIGAKGSAMNGRLAFEAAVFYMDYQDVQQVLVVPVGAALLSAFVNGESASGFGGEIGLTLKPVHGFTVWGNVSSNDLTLGSDVVQANGTTLNRRGNRLSNSPELTASGGAEYEFNIGSSGFTGVLSANVSYNDALVGYALSGTTLTSFESDPITLTSANFRLNSPQGWSAAIFLDNLNNERGSPLGSTLVDWAQRLRPRTIGMQLDFKF